MNNRLILAILLAIIITLLATVVPNQEFFFGPEDSVYEKLDDPYGPVFPRLSRANVLHVINASDLSYEEKLILVSLQGVVNKNTSTIYLEYYRTEWLQFLNETYDQKYEYISLDKVLIKFKNEVKGIAVYDPSIPSTVNVATTLSAMHGYIISSPEHITWLKSLTKTEVKVDLRDGEWGEYGDSQTIYLKVLDELYPDLRQDVFGMLSPDKTYMRDYLIAIGAMCVDIDPGPMILPEEDEVVQAILDSTPARATILGWFSGTSGLEENYGVQRLSENGKVLLPADYVPNLSVFAAYDFVNEPEPRSALTQKSIPELEDKIYLTFVFSDGDNLAVHHNNYMEMWGQPERGSIPIGWSVSPLAAEIAPPLFEYYSSKTTENDTLVSGTSGAGVFYPDFFKEDELGPLMARSGELLDRFGLDTVWLVNSYTAHETEYTKRVQAAYVDYIQPEGVFLDYADVPITSEYWIAKGDHHSGTPFIRATHMWESRDNFLAKVTVARDSTSTRPLFIFAAAHLWSVELEDVVTVVDALNATDPDSDYRLVSPTDFFRLMKTAEVKRAREKLNDLNNWPYSLLVTEKKDIEDEVESAERSLQKGDLDDAAYSASVVNSEINDIKVDILTLSTIFFTILLALIFATILFRTRKKRSSTDITTRIDKNIDETIKKEKTAFFSEMAMIFAAGTAAMLSIFNVLFAFFWDWPALLVAIGFTFMFVPLAKGGRYTTMTMRQRLLTGNLLLFIFGPATFIWSYFLPPALFGFMMVLEASPALRTGGPKVVLVPLVFSMMIAGLTIANFYALFISGFWALALGSTINLTKTRSQATPNSKPTDAPSLPTLFLVLALMAFYIPANRYLSLKTGDLDAYLWNLHLIIPIGALFIAFPFSGLIKNKKIMMKNGKLPKGGKTRAILVAITALSFTGIFFIENAFVLSTLIMTAQVCILSLALLTIPSKWYDTYPPYFARDVVLIFIVMNFIFIMPVLGYTLYITELGFSMNYILYAFPLSFAIGLIIMIIPVSFYWRMDQ